ncbi:hypothetical protein KAR91_25560 [Candidatus Pacearchaeota archaeon]|nr:hypothetical protein [Candidatus Pacearchaeota archaeon]
MRKKTIKIPLYHGEIIIIQTDDLSKIEKEYKTESLHYCDAVVFRNFKPNGYSKYVIAFDSKVDPSIIAHESLHLTGYIFHDMKAYFDIENDEPQCYLLEWIVDECHKFLKLK